jgi:hypothetical protein
MYKVNTDLVPTPITQLFVLNSEIHEYNTRQSNLFHVPDYLNNKSVSSVKYQGPVIWKSIPNHIRERPSIEAFKFHVKRHILSNQ